MTIGISKKDLLELQASIFARDKGREDELRLLTIIIDQCKELNSWLPIDENTPRNKPIKIYDSGYGQVIVSWNAYFRCFTDPHGHKYLSPTHYQELPNEPKE